MAVSSCGGSADPVARPTQGDPSPTLEHPSAPPTVSSPEQGSEQPEETIPTGRLPFADAQASANQLGVTHSPPNVAAAGALVRFDLTAARAPTASGVGVTVELSCVDGTRVDQPLEFDPNRGWTAEVLAPAGPTVCDYRFEGTIGGLPISLPTEPTLTYRFAVQDVQAAGVVRPAAAAPARRVEFAWGSGEGEVGRSPAPAPRSDGEVSGPGAISTYPSGVAILDNWNARVITVAHDGTAISNVLHGMEAGAVDGFVMTGPTSGVYTVGTDLYPFDSWTVGEPTSLQGWAPLDLPLKDLALDHGAITAADADDMRVSLDAASGRAVPVGRMSQLGTTEVLLNVLDGDIRSTVIGASAVTSHRTAIEGVTVHSIRLFSQLDDQRTLLIVGGSPVSAVEEVRLFSIVLDGDETRVAELSTDGGSLITEPLFALDGEQLHSLTCTETACALSSYPLEELTHA